MPVEETIYNDGRTFHGPAESQQLQDSTQIGSISADEEIAIRKRMEALDKLLREDKIKAKYKIEVQFGKGRSTWKHFAGAMTVYVSGTKLHGGGDEKLYWCPREDCGGIVPPIQRFVEETKDGRSIARVPCPHCQVMWDENVLIGERLFRLSPRDWATTILRTFIMLDHNADVYVKYHPTDIRYQTEMEMARKRGGEEVNKARKNRGLHIYPLRNIIRDTSNGAVLYDRILAFIKA